MIAIFLPHTMHTASLSALHRAQLAKLRPYASSGSQHFLGVNHVQLHPSADARSNPSLSLTRGHSHQRSLRFNAGALRSPLLHHHLQALFPFDHHQPLLNLLISRSPTLYGLISALLPLRLCQGLSQFLSLFFRDPPPREGLILRHIHSRTAKVKKMTCRRSYHPPLPYLRQTYRLWTHSLTSNSPTTRPKRSHL